MQNFVLEHIFSAKPKAMTRSACFSVSHLGRYTANISSDEWVTEIDKAIPGAQVLASDSISVSDLAVLEAIDAIFRSYTRSEIMDYLGWQFAQLYGPVIDADLGNAYFGDRERAVIYLRHVCGRLVEVAYPGLSSALYYLTGLDEPARSAVRATLEGVVNATATLIEGASWLDEPTKSAVATKIRSVKVELWPPTWILEKEALTRVYSHFPINATSLTGFFRESREAMTELAESDPDFEEVLWTPLSGSMPYLSYDGALNEVSISAGAVRFPLFVPGGTAAMNHGGLGSSFARQLVRSLDSRTVTSEGRCVRGDDGALTSFTAALHQRPSCLVPVDNGSSFLEVAALETAHAALVNSGARNDRRIVEEFSNEQIFYIAFCYFGCGPRGGHRDFFNDCNMALQHYTPFAEAFGCSIGSPMNPNGTCRLF
ncbi:hypothetical protein HPB52_005198 [Rhipicephalus sanguineus]|uniref:Peptidase M13 N-terminal domain-containing protein n=2 Tax=Rhipicephalus sanguineus TaxID=34632 RepID=A0A9D4QDH7_RHISA|nr:hypothetical protein HPB52_005198 [Rhipicephalus sanguineus]